MKKLLTVLVMCFAVFAAKAQVTVILEAHDVWGDGSGYQLLLDADATAYGTIIPETGPLTSSGDADAATYAEFEYKIPANADGALTTTNMVMDGSVTITIPAGTYDFCVTNPTPGACMWIAGGDNGRQNDYVFQDGWIYHFTVAREGQGDAVTIEATNASAANAPTNFTATPDPDHGLSVDLSWTNPTTTFGGTALTAIQSVVLTRNGATIQTFANPGVGATMTYTDNTIPADGRYTYTVYAVIGSDEGVAATAVAVVGNVCPITLEMVDSYGDGWNGAAIEIHDAVNALVGSYTIEDGSSVTEEIILAPGTYTFVWVAGNYDSECSFTITNSFGIEIYAGSSMTAGTFYTLNHSCGAPANAPTNFTVTPDPNQGLSASLSWVNPTTSYVGADLTAILSVELYRDATLVNSFANPAVGATMTYTDNSIPTDGAYTYTVYAVTDAGDGLAATQTAVIGNVCPVILDMVDSYGDGWNGAAIEIYDADSTLIGSYTVPSSSTNATEEVYLAPGTYTLVWVAGSYDSECSFTITNSFGIPLYTGSSMSAGTFYTLNHSCEPPAMYTVSGTVTSSVDNTPIANATVTVSGMYGGTVTTTATGAYTMDIIVSILPYSITVEADGFNGAAASFESLSGDTTINFSLTAPQFVVTYAAPIEVTTTQGLNAQYTPVTISNTGNGELTWGTNVEYLDATRAAVNEPMSYSFTSTRRVKPTPANANFKTAANAATAVAMPADVDYSPYIATINGTPTRAAWDLLSSFEASSAGQQGIATDGNFIYTCSWQSTPTAGYTFIKYDLDGNMIEGFDIAGVSGCRDLTYDGTYFYVGAGSSALYQLDFANHTLVSTINTQVSTIRHCSYDSQNDGFWIGNWSDLYLVDRSGNILVTGPELESAYGSAYDNYSEGGPYLWLFTQPNSNAVFVQYDITNNTLTNTTVDISTINANVDGIAGGAFATDTLVSGKFVIMANVQQDPNLISVFELAEAGWLSVAPGSGNVAAGQTTNLTLNFNGENPMGDYYANLTIASRNPFVGDTVIPVVFHIVAPECDAPTNLQVVPTDYTYMALTWTAPTDVTGLVEYRIYKNGNTSRYFTSTTTSYNDTVAPGNYCYFVKAYFNNGTEQCLSLASDTVCEEMLHAPSITATPSSMTFIAPAGTASGAQTATVVAYTLTENITVTTNAPFEVSVDGTTYGATATITVTGNETNATLYVRMAASATAGVHTDNVTLTSGTQTATIALNGNAYECTTITSFPYTTNFTEEAKNNCWTVENNNNDNYTWEFDMDNAYATIRYNSSMAADDWLISPTFALTGNEIASLDYWVGLGSYPETFEVYVIQGDDRTNVLPAMTVSNTSAETQTINLNSYVGEYRIGIHCTSAADQYKLFITNFTVTEGVGIEEETAANAVSIYPNPASTMLNVHAENFDNVQIINFLGQVVYSANITENDFQINVSDLSNGVYFIRLNGETTTTQKFIKK